MPNFDGKGPLKRGRIFGRGRGFCGKDRLGDTETPPDDQVRNAKNRAE